MPKFLKGWTFYIILVLASVATYWAAQYWLPIEAVAPVAEEEQAVDLMERTIKFDVIWNAVQNDPLLAVSLLVNGLLFLVLVGAGVALNSIALTSGSLKQFFAINSRLPSRWQLREVVRLMILILSLAVWLPLIRLPFLHLFPHWKPDPHLWIVLFMLMLDVLVMATILLFAREKRDNPWEAFGFVRVKFWATARIGVRAYVATFPWIIFLLVMTADLARRLGYEPPPIRCQELLFQESRPGILMLTLILASVVGPIAEEMFFRGVLYPAIRKRTNLFWGMLISSFIFALMHGHLLGIIPITLLGCVLAYLYEKTGTLFAPMLVHVMHNTILLSKSVAIRQLLDL